MKWFNSAVTHLTVLTLITTPLLQIRTIYAAPLAVSPTKSISLPPKPPPQWPFPCSSNPCNDTESPHWFYLQNLASVNAGAPLVLTVTTPPQAAQHNQPPPQQPMVTVGNAANGVTLQPINDTLGGDQQMWYASEAVSGSVNPSYLISALPLNALPFYNLPSFPPDQQSLIPTSQQLALGYFGNPGATATVTSVSSSQQGFSFSSYDHDTGLWLPVTIANTFGTIAFQSNPFSLGQTIAVRGSAGADGDWTVQQLNGNTIGYTIPLESGFAPSQQSSSGTAVAMAAVYLNQQNTPSNYQNTNYTNAFQQWTYDSNDLTICNNLGVCLNSVDSSPKAGSIVTASTKPSPVTPNFQWSFYPNGQLEQILKQANIPFPKIKAGDYKKVNNRLAALGHTAVATASCTLDKVVYTGLRCQYSNLAAPLSAYLIAVAGMKSISPKTRAQLALELTDAIAVQNLFNQLLAAFNTAFLGNQDLISQDLGDLGMDLTDQQKSHKFNWLTFLNGVAYTALSLLGVTMSINVERPSPGGQQAVSLFSNLLSTAINTYQGEQVSSTLPLANQFATTAADLYTNFYSRLLNVYASIANQETKILTDWGKLALVGSLAQDTGPNGLAWNPEVSAAIVGVGTQSYQMSLMAQLLPQFFTLYTTIGWVGGPTSGGQVANTLNSSTTGIANSNTYSATPPPMPTPDPSQKLTPPQWLNQFSTPVDPQGAQYGMWDVAWLFLGEKLGNNSVLANTYLTPQLAQDVQFANPYMLYNGFGLWSGFNLNTSNVANLNCDGAIYTLVNIGPTPVTVAIVSTENTAIGGGYGMNWANDLQGKGGNYMDLSNNHGIQGPIWRTLPPYGTLQFASSTINGSGSAQNQTIGISFWDYNYSIQKPVAYDFVDNWGCHDNNSQVQSPYTLIQYLPQGGYGTWFRSYNNDNGTPGQVVGIIVGGG